MKELLRLLFYYLSRNFIKKVILMKVMGIIKIDYNCKEGISHEVDSR